MEGACDYSTCARHVPASNWQALSQAAIEDPDLQVYKRVLHKDISGDHDYLVSSEGSRNEMNQLLKQKDEILSTKKEIIRLSASFELVTQNFRDKEAEYEKEKEKERKRHLKVEQRYEERQKELEREVDELRSDLQRDRDQRRLDKAEFRELMNEMQLQFRNSLPVPMYQQGGQLIVASGHLRQEMFQQNPPAVALHRFDPSGNNNAMMSGQTASSVAATEVPAVRLAQQQPRRGGTGHRGVRNFVPSSPTGDGRDT